MWKPINTAPELDYKKPILCRNADHWPELCLVMGGMAYDHRGIAMVGYVPIEWNESTGQLNWSNEPIKD